LSGMLLFRVLKVRALRPALTYDIAMAAGPVASAMSVLKWSITRRSR